VPIGHRRTHPVRGCVWEEEEMIYVLKQEEYFLNVKGYTFVRVALMTSEELEELLREGIYDFAATEEAAELLRNTYGVEIPKVFQGKSPVKLGDKVILLGEGQAVDITLVY
jgi:hypothetical protein